MSNQLVTVSYKESGEALTHSPRSGKQKCMREMTNMWNYNLVAAC